MLKADAILYKDIRVSFRHLPVSLLLTELMNNFVTIALFLWKCASFELSKGCNEVGPLPDPNVVVVFFFLPKAKSIIKTLLRKSWGTSHTVPFGEASPKRGTFLSPEPYKREVILRVKVYKRKGKLTIRHSEKSCSQYLEPKLLTAVIYIVKECSIEEFTEREKGGHFLWKVYGRVFCVKIGILRRAISR